MAKTELIKHQSATYEQVLALLTQVAGNIAFEKANITTAYKALVGELGNQPLPEDAEEGAVAQPHTVVSYIAAKIAEVNGAADALTTRVENAEKAIDLLNDASTVEGSVDYKIDQAFNDFATKMSDDKVVNTFKELVEYAAAHQGEYTELVTLVGSLPEDAGVTTIVAYIDKLYAAAKDYADDKKDEAILAVQGETENTVKDLEDAINGVTGFTDEQMNALKALFPTE